MSSIDIMARQAIPDRLPGTLDMLILRTLRNDSLHGWAISVAKYYCVTAAGGPQLAVESGEWERMSAAIGRVMKLA